MPEVRNWAGKLFAFKIDFVKNRSHFKRHIRCLNSNLNSILILNVILNSYLYNNYYYSFTFYLKGTVHSITTAPIRRHLHWSAENESQLFSNDYTHPGRSLFSPLTSWKRYSTLKTKTNRLKCSFNPRVVTTITPSNHCHWLYCICNMKLISVLNIYIELLALYAHFILF